MKVYQTLWEKSTGYKFRLWSKKSELFIFLRVFFFHRCVRITCLCLIFMVYSLNLYNNCCNMDCYAKSLDLLDFSASLLQSYLGPVHFLRKFILEIVTTLLNHARFVITLHHFQLTGWLRFIHWNTYQVIQSIYWIYCHSLLCMSHVIGLSLLKIHTIPPKC